MGWFSKKEKNKRHNRDEYREFLLQTGMKIATDFHKGKISKSVVEKIVDELETIIEVYAQQHWHCSIPDAWERYKKNYADMKAAELNPVTPREAVVLLAEKAYDFFKQEYSTSNEIHSIIKTYSELLAKVQMEYLYHRDTTDKVIDDVIKPLNLNHYKLREWIFNTLRSSLMRKFPNKPYYINQVLTLYNEDTDNLDKVSEEDVDKVREVVNLELANRLMLGFVIELWQSMKKHYERILQKEYPTVYDWLLTEKEWLEVLWNDLHGRSIHAVFDCLQSLDINIQLVDKDKIIYGSLNVIGQGEGVNIDKSAILGNVNNYSSIYINKIREKMIKISAGVKIENGSFVGGSVISKPTVIVGSDNNEILQSISGLISDIQKSNLEVADNLIGLLQELAQAIQTNNTVKQAETKTEFKGFWRAVGNTVKDVLQVSAHLTTVLKYLEIGLN